MITVTLSKKVYKPNEAVTGNVTWHLEKMPKDLEVRLFWYTQGRGTEDLQIEDKMDIEPVLQGQMNFSLNLPMGPYTFSGQLISLIWAVEFVVNPTDECAREELVMSPTGEEIMLGNQS